MSSGPGDRIRHPRAYVSSGESHDLMFSPRLTFWSSPQPIWSSGRRKLAFVLLALACPQHPGKVCLG
ncbi:unnamed protein product, partial [Ectocarpus sp. 12 AP-2014]